MLAPRTCYLAAAALLSALLFACTSAPETGRSQLLLVSPSDEAQMGLQAFQQIKRKTPVSRNRSASQQLNEVGRIIAAVAPLPNANWEFVLFEDPDNPNAFALPGGKVGVYSGLLPVTQNQAGLATVIGHEVAHATARHGAERAPVGGRFEHL